MMMIMRCASIILLKSDGEVAQTVYYSHATIAIVSLYDMILRYKSEPFSFFNYVIYFS